MARAPVGMPMGTNGSILGGITDATPMNAQPTAMSYLNTSPPAGANYGANPLSTYAELGLAGGSGFGSEYGTGYGAGTGSLGAGSYGASGWNSAGFYSAAYAEQGAAQGLGACPPTAGAAYGAQAPYGTSAASLGYGAGSGPCSNTQQCAGYAGAPHGSAASFGCGGCFPGGAAGGCFPGGAAGPMQPPPHATMAGMPMQSQYNMLPGPPMTMQPPYGSGFPSAGPPGVPNFATEVDGKLGRAEKSPFARRGKSSSKSTRGSGRSGRSQSPKALKCKAGHSLQPFETPTGGYICSMCKTSIRRGKQTMHCEYCDYYLCNACSGAKAKPGRRAKGCC